MMEQFIEEPSIKTHQIEIVVKLLSHYFMIGFGLMLHPSNSDQ